MKIALNEIPKKFFSIYLFVHTFQIECKVTIPGIDELAPSFSADTNKGKISFPKDYKGKWVIFFSHPADFTPVCAEEYKKLVAMIPEFKKLNTEILGLSVDPKYIHDMWKKDLENHLKLSNQKKKSNSKVDFPIISDIDREISKKYGMIHPAQSKTQTIRAVYFIDPKGIIKSIFYYPISNGRNFKEIKRLLTALQITEKTKNATGPNWQPGQATIKVQKRKQEYYL